jgi:hypothetical protein
MGSVSRSGEPGLRRRSATVGQRGELSRTRWDEAPLAAFFMNWLIFRPPLWMIKSAGKL